jgi:hypothetical protein
MEFGAVSFLPKENRRDETRQHGNNSTSSDKKSIKKQRWWSEGESNPKTRLTSLAKRTALARPKNSTKVHCIKRRLNFD